MKSYLVEKFNRTGALPIQTYRLGAQKSARDALRIAKGLSTAQGDLCHSDRSWKVWRGDGCAKD